MAMRAVTVVAKTLLSEEAESVVKSATRMIRTSMADESGSITQTTGMSVERAVTDTGIAVGDGALNRALGIEVSQPKIPEIDIGNSPREITLPGTRGAPDITPGKSSLLEQKQTKPPRELDFPDPKTNPEIKPGETDIADEVSKAVPTDPEALIFTVEQGRKHRGPEVGDKRAVVEIDDRREKVQESIDDGSKTRDVDRPGGGPEVGNNPRDQLIN